MKLKKLSHFSHFLKDHTIRAVVLIVVVGLVATIGLKSYLDGRGTKDSHTVVATEFWVGEPADDSNAHIANHESAWVGDWLRAFGGVDDPTDRCGYDPCGFTPRENTFYVAVPFNDLDGSGKPKSEEILRRIPWYTGVVTSGHSLMKNRWVEIRYGSKVAYGQIQDAGPMHEDDIEYVFGTAKPKYQAGIDLSPALNDYLETDGYEVVTWRFVEEPEVPDGPWKRRVTTSQVKY